MYKNKGIGKGKDKGIHSIIYIIMYSLYKLRYLKINVFILILFLQIPSSTFIPHFRSNRSGILLSSQFIPAVGKFLWLVRLYSGGHAGGSVDLCYQNSPGNLY